MSGSSGISNSTNLQTLHYLRMVFKNSRSLFRLWYKRPVAAVPGAAQNNSIAARKHVAAAEITVVNLRLRQKHFQMSAHRLELLITKPRPGAQAGAAEDDRLRQPSYSFTR